VSRSADDTWSEIRFFLDAQKARRSRRADLRNEVLDDLIVRSMHARLASILMHDDDDWLSD